MRVRWINRGRHLVAPSRLRIRDLAAEALAGILQRPGRSALTMLGAVLGIGTFVAVIGLSETANGQISKQFSVLAATQVTVSDSGAQGAVNPVLDFPANADADAGRIRGVIAAGVWWQVEFAGAEVSNLPAASTSDDLSLPVYAASPGALQASGARLSQGVLYNDFHEAARQDVAVLSAVAAAQLGITSVANQPAIFIQNHPFTVVGIIGSDQRLPQLGLGIAVPESAALQLWGRPSPDAPAEMLIHTRLGAAQVVAGQVAVAIRPDDPGLLSAAAAPAPTTLQHAVTSSLSSLFLALAAVAVVVGAIGIANTTLVSILERVGEIGLRRSLGARPVHVAAQFIAESTTLGLLGGLLGTGIGVLATLAVTVDRDWTAVLAPWVVIAGPVAGAAIGLVAGLYPAVRASTIEPAAALRH